MAQPRPGSGPGKTVALARLGHARDDGDATEAGAGAKKDGGAGEVGVQEMATQPGPGKTVTQQAVRNGGGGTMRVEGGTAALR